MKDTEREERERREREERMRREREERGGMGGGQGGPGGPGEHRGGGQDVDRGTDRGREERNKAGQRQNP